MPAAKALSKRKRRGEEKGHENQSCRAHPGFDRGRAGHPPDRIRAGLPAPLPRLPHPQTHDFEGGAWDDTDRIFEAFLENPLLRGITFSGGEPFCQPKPLRALADRVHGVGKDVTVYTGWTLEALEAMHDPDIDALLAACDVLVDGPFIEAEKNLELAFRGSENQRLIDMNKTREKGRIVPLDLGG